MLSIGLLNPHSPMLSIEASASTGLVSNMYLVFKKKTKMPWTSMLETATFH